MSTTELILKIVMEITLGTCMKLFCDNGRIHWSDFVNGYLWWIPGLETEEGDGVGREVRAMNRLAAEAQHEEEMQIAAK